MSRTIGLNAYSGPLSGSTESLIFADLFFMSGFFNGFGSNPSPGYDASSYPLFVNSTTGNTQTQVALNGRIPAGDYTLSADGIGTLQVIPQSGPGFDGQKTRTVTFDGSGTPVTLNLPTATGGNGYLMFFRITASSQSNHLRNIKFVLPNHVGRIFNQGYLDQFRGFTAIRFLDWSVINAIGGTITNWTNGARLGGAGFCLVIRQRICEEYQQALINEVKQFNGQDIDWWLQAPHFATYSGTGNWCDGAFNLIQNGATLDGHTIAPLNSGSKVYFEVSNETWNTFPQQSQMNARYHGADAGIVATWNATYAGTHRVVNGATITVPFMGGFEYVSHIKAKLEREFKNRFSGTSRTVLTTVMQQGVVPAYGQLELTQHDLPNLYDNLTTPIDVLGCGLYCHPGTSAGGNTSLTALKNLYATDPVTALNQYFAAENVYLGFLAPFLAQYKTMADSISAHMAMYEVGLDANAFVDNTLRAFLLVANNDPRNEALATAMINAAPDGVGPIMWYYDCGPDGNFFWGATKYTGQPASAAPVWRALQSAIGTPAPSRLAVRRPRGLLRLRNS